MIKSKQVTPEQIRAIMDRLDPLSASEGKTWIGGDPMKKYRWAVPLAVIIILSLAMAFRWEKVATKTFSDVVVVIEKDRWTGELFISQYGNLFEFTFHRIPNIVYDHVKKDLNLEAAKELRNKQKALIIAWWVLLAVSAVWLLVEFYRPRREESLPF